MEQYLFAVTIRNKYGDRAQYNVSAKDDVQARKKAVEKHVKIQNDALAQAKHADTIMGELSKVKGAYTFSEKEIAYCEIAYVGVFSG